MTSLHVYEVRPRKDHRGVNLISDALPFGQLCRFSLRFSLLFTSFIMIEIRAIFCNQFKNSYM
jgi:hypothetical protein